jgi:hypothetical protein
MSFCKLIPESAASVRVPSHVVIKTHLDIPHAPRTLHRYPRAPTRTYLCTACVSASAVLLHELPLSKTCVTVPAAAKAPLPSPPSSTDQLQLLAATPANSSRGTPSIQRCVTLMVFIETISPPSASPRGVSPPSPSTPLPVSVPDNCRGCTPGIDDDDPRCSACRPVAPRA